MAESTDVTLYFRHRNLWKTNHELLHATIHEEGIFSEEDAENVSVVISRDENQTLWIFHYIDGEWVEDLSRRRGSEPYTFS